MSRWYYCENGHVPTMLRNPFAPPPCTKCHAPTQAAHDVVRLNVVGAGGYQVRWHTEDVNGNILDRPMLKLVATVNNFQYTVLLEDDVLPYDTLATNLSQNTALKPPGGGVWVDRQIMHHNGGLTMGRNTPPIPATLHNPSLKLGSHGGGNQYGLIHILHRHISMFNNMSTRPQAVFNLVNFRDNLRTMTGSPTGKGTGVRQIAVQQTNNNIALHGIAHYQRAMLVIDQSGGGFIKTCWSEQNRLGGLGQNPIILRLW